MFDNIFVPGRFWPRGQSIGVVVEGVLVQILALVVTVLWWASTATPQMCEREIYLLKKSHMYKNVHQLKRKWLCKKAGHLLLVEGYLANG